MTGAFAWLAAQKETELATSVREQAARRASSSGEG